MAISLNVCLSLIHLFYSCSLSEDVNMKLVEKNVPFLRKFFAEISDVIIKR